jgi:hypothetical protein
MADSAITTEYFFPAKKERETYDCVCVSSSNILGLSVRLAIRVPPEVLRLMRSLCCLWRERGTVVC